MELPFIVIIVILLPIVIRGYYLLLKKTEFELKGFELALYEIAAIILIIDSEKVYEITFATFCIVLAAIGIYYFVRMIKKKEYINIWIVISYIIMSIINTVIAVNICDKIHDGWCMCTLLYLLLAFIVPGYTLILNGITFIIRKIKKIESKETVKINKGIIVVLFVIIILFACCGLVVVK